MTTPDWITALSGKVDGKSLIISVFGLGRIGLPTAVEFARHGYKTIGVDINQRLLVDLKESKTFVDEPGLAPLLASCNEKGMIDYTTDATCAIKESDVMVLCLPTPINEDMGPDYSVIESMSVTIGKHLGAGKLVIVESSVSPTTIEQSVVPIISKESGLVVNRDFGACSCPERADPGRIVENFDKIPRIVGGSSPPVTDLVVKLYKTITAADIVPVSTPGTANAVKLTENIFRDVNIALVNELAVLYEMLGIDIKEVIKGCSTKYNFQPHFPGPGVGGPCLPANPYYIIKDATKVNHIPFLIRVAREVNDRMPEHVRDLVVNALNVAGHPLNGIQVTILGVSYKANVRDVQISPAVKVMRLLVNRRASVRVFDPYYKGEEIDGIRCCDTLEEAVDGAMAIAILTDHDEFKDIDFHAMLAGKRVAIIDARNIYNGKRFPEGTVYCGVGRPMRVV